MRTLALLAVLVLAGGARTHATIPSFDHVVVIVFENKEESAVLGRRDAPTFNAMAKRYARLTRYYGVTHPSLPNYLALVSGTTAGITTDCTSCIVAARNLINRRRSPVCAPPTFSTASIRSATDESTRRPISWLPAGHPRAAR